MTYIIKIKKSPDVIRLADERGKVVKDMWLSEDGDLKIDLGSWSGRLSSIETISHEGNIQSTYEGTDKYHLTPDEQKRADSARNKLSSFFKEKWGKDGSHNITI